VNFFSFPESILESEKYRIEKIIGVKTIFRFSKFKFGYNLSVKDTIGVPLNFSIVISVRYLEKSETMPHMIPDIGFSNRFQL